MPPGGYRDAWLVYNTTGTKRDMAKIKPLKECPLFKDFSDKEIALVSQIVSEKKIPGGTPLFVEGMMGDTLFIVKQGTVKITRNVPGLGEVGLGEYMDGEYFGEMALVDGGTRAVSARTAEDTELLTIDREDFQKLKKKEPAVAVQLVIAIARGLGAKTQKNLGLMDEYLAWRKEKGKR